MMFMIWPSFLGPLWPGEDDSARLTDRVPFAR
jgi:hypothetical protein